MEAIVLLLRSISWAENRQHERDTRLRWRVRRLHTSANVFPHQIVFSMSQMRNLLSHPTGKSTPHTLFIESHTISPLCGTRVSATVPKRSPPKRSGILLSAKAFLLMEKDVFRKSSARSSRNRRVQRHSFKNLRKKFAASFAISSGKSKSVRAGSLRRRS